MRPLPGGIPLSLVLHALVALGVSRIASHAPEPVVGRNPATFMWITAPRPDPASEQPRAESQRSADPEPATGPDAADGVPAVANEPDRTRAPGAIATLTESAENTAPPRASDLGSLPGGLTEARRRAIESLATERERGSSYRSFIFPGTLAEQQAFAESEGHRRTEAGLQAPLTAFDSPSKGRAGLSERTSLGQYVRWVSDDCYETLGTGNLFVLPSAEWLYSMPTVNCVDPRPRSDLFASAKPAYLMDAKERAAADERLQRIERLRRPTTGAPTSLEE
jgi:hypothetical protein